MGVVKMKESHGTRLMGQISVSGWNRIGPAQVDDTIVNMVVDMITYWLGNDEASDITEDGKSIHTRCVKCVKYQISNIWHI